MKIDDSYSLYDSLVRGFDKKKARDVEEEKKKVGVWRGGSSGCITESGIVLGADPQETVLRFEGVQMPTDYDTQLMFDAGLTNEDSFVQYLVESGTPFKCEEEIPMSYTLDSGTKVTGRPDVIVGLVDEAGVFCPTLGIELKLVASDNSAFSKALFGRGIVDTKHLIQSCHYASKFEIPWVLAYSRRGYTMVPFYARNNPDKFFIQQDHRAVRSDDKGIPFMIGPFQAFYDVTLGEDGDTFHLNGEPTLVTKSGIRRYYEYCDRCVREKEIPRKRSGDYDHFGNKEKKNKVKLYDKFAEAKKNGTYDAWVDSARELSNAD